MAVSLNYEMLESRCISSPASPSQGRRSPLHRKVARSCPAAAARSPPRHCCFTSNLENRGKRELELDFRIYWEEFHSSSSEKEKEKALIMVVDAFCKLVKKQADVTQLITNCKGCEFFFS